MISTVKKYICILMVCFKISIKHEKITINSVNKMFFFFALYFRIILLYLKLGLSQSKTKLWSNGNKKENPRKIKSWDFLIGHGICGNVYVKHRNRYFIIYDAYATYSSNAEVPAFQCIVYFNTAFLAQPRSTVVAGFTRTCSWKYDLKYSRY